MKGRADRAAFYFFKSKLQGVWFFQDVGQVAGVGVVG